MYRHNLAAKIQKAERNAEFSTSVSKEIGALLARTDDPELHKALAELKEAIDFSTNSTQNTCDETVIRAKLNALKEAVMDKADAGEIQRLISEISTLWRSRNTNL